MLREITDRIHALRNRAILKRAEQELLSNLSLDILTSLPADAPAGLVKHTFHIGGYRVRVIFSLRRSLAHHAYLSSLIVSGPSGHIGSLCQQADRPIAVILPHDRPRAKAWDDFAEALEKLVNADAASRKISAPDAA